MTICGGGVTNAKQKEKVLVANDCQLGYTNLNSKHTRYKRARVKVVGPNKTDSVETNDTVPDTNED